MKNIFLIIACISYASFATAAEVDEKTDADPRATTSLILLNKFHSHHDPVTTLQWNPNSPVYASGTIPIEFVETQKNTSTLCVHNTKTNEPTQLPVYREISTLSWLTVNRLIVGSQTTEPVDVLNEQGVTLQQSNNTEYGTVYSISSNPQTQVTALASVSYIPIGLWDITKDQYRSLPWTDDDNPTLSVEYDAEGTLLASGDMDGFVKIWDPESNALVHTFETNGDFVHDVRWNRTGTMLAGTAGRLVYIWDTRTHKLLRKISVVGKVKSLAWSTDDTSIASGSSDGVVRIWNVNTGKCTAASLLINNGAVNTIDWSSVTNQLAAGDEEGRVSILEVQENNFADDEPS